MILLPPQLRYLAVRLGQALGVGLIAVAVLGFTTNIGRHQAIIFAISLVLAAVPLGLLPTQSLMLRHIRAKDLLDLEKKAATKRIITHLDGGLTGSPSITQAVIGRNLYDLPLSKDADTDLFTQALKALDVSAGLTFASSDQFVQGAPSIVMKRSTDIWDLGHIRKIGKRDHAFFADYEAAQALLGNRVLALGFKNGASTTLLGLISLALPVHRGTKTAALAAAQAGVSTILRSADLPEVTQAIQRKAGLDAAKITQPNKSRNTQAFKDAVDTIAAYRLNLLHIKKALRTVFISSVAQTILVLVSIELLALYFVAPALTIGEFLLIDLAAILPVYSLVFDQKHPVIMRQPPHIIGSRLITRTELGGLFGFGTIIALLSYANYLFFYVRINLDPRHLEATLPQYHQATSLTCVTLLFCLYVHLFFERADHHERFFTDYLSHNKQLIAACTVSLMIVSFAVYTSWLQSLLSTSSLNLVDWSSALFCGLLYACFRLLQRYTRKHTRNALVALHLEAN